jgi:integrase
VLRAHLAEMLAGRAARRGRPIGRDEPLFVNRAGLPVNRDKFRQTVIRPALRAAGLLEQLRTYDLRHGHASMLIDMGVNPLVLAQRMGHSGPSVTLREYGHLFEGVQKRVSEQLEELRRDAAGAARDDRAPISRIHERRSP